jgi:hypothetical protein
LLGREAVGIAHIAKETGLSRQAVYRIKDDPAGSRVRWRRGGCDLGVSTDVKM